jgi:hypothetical protein
VGPCVFGIFVVEGAVGVWVGDEPEDKFSMVFHI